MPAKKLQNFAKTIFSNIVNFVKRFNAAPPLPPGFPPQMLAEILRQQQDALDAAMPMAADAAAQVPRQIP